MFAFLRGLLVLKPSDFRRQEDKSDSAAVELWLDVAGVGYSVFTAPSIAKRFNPSEEQILYISQSSALYGGETTLYGFATIAERELFELFRDLPGVGSKKALEFFEKAVSKSSERFLEAIARGDAKILSSFFGFSPKTSAKIIAQLREKAVTLLGHLSSRKLPARRESAKSGLSTSGVWIDGELWERAKSALLSLGFGGVDSEAALNEALAKMKNKESGEPPNLEKVIRYALQELTVA